MHALTAKLTAVLWLASAAVAAALPIGAPRPLDPKLAAIAPPECLWYASYSGQGPADPASTNHLEQLLAEPQIDRFVEEIKKQVKIMIEKEATDPRQKVLAAELPKLLKVVLTRPLAAYVESVQPAAPKDKVNAALVLNAGDQRSVVEGALAELLKLHGGQGPKIVAESAGGVDWQKIETPDDAPHVWFGWHDDYFILAIGAEAPTKLIERFDGSAPDWLTKIRAEHPIARETSIGYVNIKAILTIARPFIEADDPKAWPIIEKLGLTHLLTAHSLRGYDDAGCAAAMHLVTDGEKVGLLGLVPTAPLTKDHLAGIPKDALVAFAVRLDAGAFVQGVVELASQFDEHAKENFEKGLADIKQQAGIDVREDLLASLGDAWIVYLPGGDLMTCWMNAAAAVDVKDAAKLRTLEAKVIEVLKQHLAAHGRGASLVTSDAGGATIYTVNPGEATPVAPSWCIGDKRLVVGVSPQAVRSVLDRKAEDSLAANEMVGKALADKAAPVVLSYQDTPQLVRSMYPLMQMGAMMAGGEMQKQGINFDWSTLPTADTIVKHLRPSVATLSVGSDGISVNSLGSISGADSVMASSPVGVALLLPAVQAAREAARRNGSMNNEKQIMLAMFNYESAKGSFPPQASFSDEGKPLLSWRVLILPYVEQQELYNKFHLDEPWDSPNNLALIPQMPTIYLDPSSGLAVAEGRTSYLAPKGEDQMMTGEKAGRKLMTITDGTSNTIGLVQVDDKHAEPWTKPNDWEFNPAKPKEGLGGLHPGIFLAGYCDGSVRAIALGIDDDALKAFFTATGGEPVQ